MSATPSITWRRSSSTASKLELPASIFEKSRISLMILSNDSRWCGL